MVDSPLVQRELDVAATNANTGIGHLEDKGILTMVSGKYRNRKWAAPEILDALDEFAERAGRTVTPLVGQDGSRVEYGRRVQRNR